jgi:DNA modification methylase
MHAMKIRDRIKELRRVRARDLRPNPRNWRVHPKPQVDALRSLLNEIGYADALIARELPDGSLELIDGHLRAETTPDELVPVLVLDVTEEEADKLLATLDPLAGMAEVDGKRLQELLTRVRSDDQAVLELLKRTAGNRLWQIVHPEEIDEAEVSLERADELRKQWGTERGQLWQIGPNRLLCGDCTVEDEVRRLWCGEDRFRMVWTDAPYGISYVIAKNKALKHLHKGTRVKTDIINDSLSPAQTHDLFRAALTVAVKWAKRGAACYAAVPAGPLMVGFIQAFVAAGFSFKHHLVWVKQQMVLGRSDYHYRHEPIIYGWIETGPHYFTEDRTQTTVFEVNKPASSIFHPTQKPVELIARMVSNSSQPGERIYDPFSGSGSTLLAAHQLGRIGYGCEIHPGYIAVTLERLSLLGLRPALVK